MSDVIHIRSAIEQGDGLAAQPLGVSTASAEGDWGYARVWLQLETTGGRDHNAAS